MIAAKHRSRSEIPRAEPECRASACTRCGKVGHLHAFPRDAVRGGGDLCGDCRTEWDNLLAEVSARWHAGLRVCFFCRRPLGDHRFPARSPFGASCAECGVTLSAVVVD